MAYTKQTWATGDVITANKLNHMEDGIADNVFIFTISCSADENTGHKTNPTADKTYSEIMTALQNDIPVIGIIKTEFEDGYTTTLITSSINADSTQNEINMMFGYFDVSSSNDLANVEGQDITVTINSDDEITGYDNTFSYSATGTVERYGFTSST